MKSILKKTIVITLLLVLALSLGLIAVGCNDTPSATEDSFFSNGSIILPSQYEGYSMPRYLSPIDSYEDNDLGVISGDIFCDIVEYGHIVSLGTLEGAQYPLVEKYTDKAIGGSLEDIANIGEKEITYFGGRAELNEGEVLLHKWAYYQLLFDLHGGVDLLTYAFLSDTKITLPKMIATYSTNVSLLQAYPLVIDKYNYAGKYMVRKGDNMEYAELNTLIGKEVDGEYEYREVTVAGFYTTGGEDYLLNTEFARADFAQADYTNLQHEWEATERYATATITATEQNLLSRYYGLISVVYYG